MPSLCSKTHDFVMSPCRFFVLSSILFVCLIEPITTRRSHVFFAYQAEPPARQGRAENNNDKKDKRVLKRSYNSIGLDPGKKIHAAIRAEALTPQPPTLLFHLKQVVLCSNASSVIHLVMNYLVSFQRSPAVKHRTLTPFVVKTKASPGCKCEINIIVLDNPVKRNL